ncbi:MAG: response regulator [Rhodocyclaceae bacterium]
MLIDNALPEGALAGIQAAITRPDSMRDTPMLFMSANDSQAARIGALRAGGQAYLLKPIEPSQVLDALENVVEAASGRPHRVLILDDDPAMVAHHSAVLGAAGFDTVELDDPSRLLEVMREQPPDIVLLDLYMPDTSGSDLAAMIHQIPAFAGVPILFVSAEHDIAAQQAAMLSGGDDFLIKPVCARPPRQRRALSSGTPPPAARADEERQPDRPARPCQPQGAAERRDASRRPPRRHAERRHARYRPLQAGQ